MQNLETTTVFDGDFISDSELVREAMKNGNCTTIHDFL